MRKIKSARNSPAWEKMTSHLCKYEVLAHSPSYLTLNEAKCEVSSVLCQGLN